MLCPLQGEKGRLGCVLVEAVVLTETEAADSNGAY